ncbi:uncharacterized protein [Arachis hypogaea]|uniref:uncharacterized protein isoform X2 n=1 Tax=Arachis hypogaea TaxID=3818 RepID=UPI0007AF1364|nr:uncharacterized protein LOC112726541 isoform X2 [Arachis hypogaea]
MVLRGWIRVFQVLARELRRLGIISRIYLLYELEVLPVILCHHLKQNWTISSFLLFVAVVCSEEWPMSLLLLKRLANLFEGTLRIRKGVQSPFPLPFKSTLSLSSIEGGRCKPPLLPPQPLHCCCRSVELGRRCCGRLRAQLCRISTDRLRCPVTVGSHHCAAMVTAEDHRI